MTVIGGEAVLLYGLDVNGNLVPLKLNSDGTLSAASSGLVLGSTPTTQAIGDVAAAGASVKAAPELHVHGMPGFASPSAVGYAIAAGVAATLPRSDHGHSLSLTNTSAVLTSNQTLGSADTLTDLTGISLTLAAGTWLLIATAVFVLGGTTYGQMTIADSGNTDYAQAKASGATVAIHLGCQAIVTPGGSTTYKMRGQAGGTTTVVQKQGDNAGQVSTRLIAIRIG